MTEEQKPEEEKPVELDPQKYRKQLADARLYLCKNGAGQLFAHLKSRSAAESLQLFNDMNEYLKARLAFKSDDVLEELSKQNSAFHRKLSKETAHCLSELRGLSERLSETSSTAGKSILRKQNG